METLMKLQKNGIYLHYEDIVSICERYRLSELSIFGSSIRDDFNEDSDIDILIAYEDVWQNDPFDFLDIKEELEQLTGRAVDISFRDGLRNPIRREDILGSREILYATA